MLCILIETKETAKAARRSITSRKARKTDPIIVDTIPFDLLNAKAGVEVLFFIHLSSSFDLCTDGTSAQEASR